MACLVTTAFTEVMFVFLELAAKIQQSVIWTLTPRLLLLLLLLRPEPQSPTRTAATGPLWFLLNPFPRCRWIQIATVAQIKLQCVFILKQLSCQSSEAQRLSPGNKGGDARSIKAALWARLKDLRCDAAEQTRGCRNKAAIMKLCSGGGWAGAADGSGEVGLALMCV